MFWYAGMIVFLIVLLLIGPVFLFRGVCIRLFSKLKYKSLRLFGVAIASRTISSLLASLDAMFTINSEGRIVDFSPAAERLFGYSRDAVQTRRLTDFLKLPEALQARRFGDLAALLENSESVVLNRRFEAFGFHRDGSKIPVEFCIFPVRIGNFRSYIVSVRDISERYLSELALAESSERWKLALEGAGDSVWDWDIPSGQVIYSTRWWKMLGYERGAFESSHSAWQELLHPDDSVFVMSQLLEHLVGKVPSFSAECRMRSQTGEWKWIHSRGTVVQRAKSDGRPVRLVGTHTDISERKKIEVERGDLLIQAHRLTVQLQQARATELSVGTQIQQSLLTTQKNRRLSHLWLSTFNQASQGIDGDFFEVICLSEQTIDIVAGDVMGKGINAALMGAAVKMQLSRSLIELTTGAVDLGRLPQPSEVVRSLHSMVTPHLQALEAFVTLCYLRIDVRTNTVTWVGCGHEEALLARSRGTFLALSNQHPPLGVLDTIEFVQETTAMTALDSVFLHSDGLPDAILVNGERLGVYDVRTTLASLLKVHKTPGAILSSLRSCLLGDGVRFTDDLTMLLVTRSDPGSAILRLELEVHLDSIAKVRTMVNEDAVRLGFSVTEASLITVAAVEAFTNIVRHAKGLLPGAPVEILSTRLQNSLQIELIYLGDYFKPAIDLHKPNLDEFPEGGFGLSIIQDVCDEVYYAHEAGVNTIRLCKFAVAEDSKLAFA